MTETSLAPVLAEEATVMLATSFVVSLTVIDLTFTPEPKLTDVSPAKKPEPLTVTFNVCSRLADTGIILEMVGTG